MMSALDTQPRPWNHFPGVGFFATPAGGNLSPLLKSAEVTAVVQGQEAAARGSYFLSNPVIDYPTPESLERSGGGVGNCSDPVKRDGLCGVRVAAPDTSGVSNIYSVNFVRARHVCGEVAGDI